MPRDASCPTHTRHCSTILYRRPTSAKLSAILSVKLSHRHHSLMLHLASSTFPSFIFLSLYIFNNCYFPCEHIPSNVLFSSAFSSSLFVLFVCCFFFCPSHLHSAVSVLQCVRTVYPLLPLHYLCICPILFPL